MVNKEGMRRYTLSVLDKNKESNKFFREEIFGRSHKKKVLKQDHRLENVNFFFPFSDLFVLYRLGC
jgi:hypothetical protein